MSSAKQKRIENERYPHIKRNWIGAIKAIRNGVVFKREYNWWNIRKDWMPLRNVRGLLRTTGGYIKHPDPGHWRQNQGVWNLTAPGVSSSSSSDRLTEEQENEIAENIYDWWISGKSYKRWYAEKFKQMKLDFGEEL